MTIDELMTKHYTLFRFGGHKEAIETLREDIKLVEQAAYERGKRESAQPYTGYDFG